MKPKITIPPLFRRIVAFGWAGLIATTCLFAGALGTALAQLGWNDLTVEDISQIAIHAKTSDWVFMETNLTLVHSNSLFIGRDFSVPETAVSNLLAAMKQPPRPQLDPVNLGLTAAWLETNRNRLLTAFGGEAKDAVFPLASPRQRAWLTNALSDLNLLGDAIRHSAGRNWTDDHPSFRVKLMHGDRAVAELHSQRQPSFMLPWTLTWRDSSKLSFNADISRAVAALLPSEFLHRERIQGDLLTMITAGFPENQTVRQQVQAMTLEETLGPQTNRILREFDLMNCSMPAGSYERFPDTWMATLHRTNWPAHLFMPVLTQVEQGVVRRLPQWLDTADARVRPILQSRWLMGLIQGTGKTIIKVAPEGSMADDAYLRGHMAKVGLGEFYDQIKPLMQHGLAFSLIEQIGYDSRASEWVALPEGKLLLVKFSGGGVLGWPAEQLGYRGSASDLEPHSLTSNMVGVFITPEGQIERVVPQAKR